MRILIVGADARSHAFAWKLKRDRPDTELLLAPGTDGSARMGESLAIPIDDTAALTGLATERRVDLTIVSPEGPLAAGIVDAFQSAGLRIFGPTRAAAEIESSKAWAKDFMQRHGIPTARFESCSTMVEAERAIGSFHAPPVVKDDALAGGKGVTVPDTFEQAVAAARAILERPGGRVVIEERLDGWETSAMVFSDGLRGVCMPASCDYKRVGDGDRGPNTGGMGAYAPAAIADDLRSQIQVDVVDKAIAGMAAEGRPFTGILYPGLMITAEGPRVIEFNCRLGDPEGEVLLPLLESDLIDVVEACIERRLDPAMLRWSDRACCAVVMASHGYPQQPLQAAPRGWEELAEAVAFRAGSSGRVLTVSALGATLHEARAAAYAAVRQIDFPGAVYRTDIGMFDRAVGPA